MNIIPDQETTFVGPHGNGQFWSPYWMDIFGKRHLRTTKSINMYFVCLTNIVEPRHNSRHALLHNVRAYQMYQRIMLLMFEYFA